MCSSASCTRKTCAFVTRARDEIKLDVEQINRVILAADSKDGKAPAGVAYYVTTSDGNRLAVTGDTPLTLSLATPWGPVDISSENLRWLTHADAEQPGRQVTLKDGSQFFAFMQATPMKLQTARFGEIELPSPEVRVISDASLQSAEAREKQREQEPKGPMVLLVGNNRIAGRINVDRLHLIIGGHEIPVQPDMIRSLENVADESSGAGLDGGARFKLEMWDGSTLEGRPREAVLPIELAGKQFQVPASDLRSATFPTPQPPEEVRAEVGQLIRRLGSDQWQQREKATAQLITIGTMARPQLVQHAQAGERSGGSAPHQARAG